MSRRMTRLEWSASWWRQFGFWGLTANAVAGLPALFVCTWTAPDVDWGVAAGAYATVLATWAAAAGIREWGKQSERRAEEARAGTAAPPKDVPPTAPEEE